MKSWKHWPYWLRGGVIGGGAALLFYLLLNGCSLLAGIGLGPGEVGFTYYCLVFYVVSPIFPAGWLLSFLLPAFGYSSGFVEAYAPILSVPAWFIGGVFIGVLIDFLKNKKSLR